MTRHLLTAICLVTALSLLCGCDDEESKQWVITWADEFDGPVDQLPDSSKWTYDIGGNGWGNAQLEYDTNRPENVSLDGQGNLRIVAREESYEGSNYTSARIKTSNLFDQSYGRFEARIKLPIGQGIWPAFWLLGSDFGTVGWPTCGEIDIMEYRGQQPSVVHGSLHGPGYSGGSALSESYSLDGGNFSSDYHVFAIQWEKDKILWSVDGNVYHLARPANLPRGTQWVFDHPFFIILNVAVGGHYVGSPNDSTNFPQTMLIDWVKVYSLK